MVVYSFEDRVPSIGKDTYVFESATVMGDVTLGEGVYVGAGAVVRGDYGKIVVGDRTSIEDNVVIHARPGERTVIGNDVTLGHGCIVHNTTIDDLAVIGMGSVVSDYSKVGRWGVVAEGAVIISRKEVGPEEIFAGVPAKKIGNINDEYKRTWIKFKANYPDLARRYVDGIKRLD
ncbi:MAG: gamma carbonic anhydrase family protein [Thermoplasmatota archaeon]